MTRESHSCPFCGFRTWDGTSCSRCAYTLGKNPIHDLDTQGLRFPLRFSALAELMGVSRSHLKVCEAEGRWPPAQRDARGHRIYFAEDVRRIRLALDRSDW